MMVIKIDSCHSDTFRVYALPPGTPRDRLETVRRAIRDTLKDPQFLEDAKKSKLSVDPIDGADVQRLGEGCWQWTPSSWRN